METFDEDYSQRVLIPFEVAEKHPNCYARIVEGNCMEPRYHDGDVVVMDPDQRARLGEAVVVTLTNGHAYLGLMGTSGDGVILTPTNHAHHIHAYIGKDIVSVAPVVYHIVRGIDA